MSLMAEMFIRRTGELYDGRMELRSCPQTKCILTGAYPLCVLPFKLQTLQDAASALWHLMQAYTFIGPVVQLHIIRQQSNGQTHFQEMGADFIQEVWSSEQRARDWFEPQHFYYPKGEPHATKNNKVRA